MAASILVGLAVVGCGEVVVPRPPAFDAAEPVDASDLDADASGEDPVDGSGPRCSSEMPFARVEPVAGLNGRNFQCCAVLTDPLTAYFSAGDGGLAQAADIFRATRPSVEAPFDTRELLIGDGTLDSFWAPTLSADGQMLYYNRAPADDLSGVKIHRSVRDGKGRFGPGEVVDLGGGDEREADPSLSDRGLFFIRGELLHFSRPDGDGFALGQPIDELDAGNVDNFDILPAATSDGRTVYWGTRRSPSEGDNDIWVADLETEQTFGPPRPAVGVNGEYFEAPSWVSPDQCQLFFTTTRDVGNQIWVATRRSAPPP